MSCLRIAKRVGHSNYDRLLVDETYTKVHVWRELVNQQGFRLVEGWRSRTPASGLLFRHRPRHLFRRLPARHRLRDDQLPRFHPDLR